MRAPEPIAPAALRGDLEAAVREAGAIAKRTFQTTLKTWNKDGGSPVSEADIAVDKFLRERLTRLAPDCGWLSEETEDDRARLGAPRLWVVDPIDGTRAYHRRPRRLDDLGRAGGRGPSGDRRALRADAGRALPRGSGTKARRSTALPSRRNRGCGLRRDPCGRPETDARTARQGRADLVAEPKVFSLALRLARVAAGTLDLAFAVGQQP